MTLPACPAGHPYAAGDPGVAPAWIDLSDFLGGDDPRHGRRMVRRGVRPRVWCAQPGCPHRSPFVAAKGKIAKEAANERREIPDDPRTVQ